MFASFATAVSLALALGTVPPAVSVPGPPGEAEGRDAAPEVEAPETQDPETQDPEAQDPEAQAGHAEAEPEVPEPGGPDADAEPDAKAPALLQPTPLPEPPRAPADAPEVDGDPFGDDADAEPFDDDAFGDDADADPVDDDAVGPPISDADGRPPPSYDPTRDSPEALRARHWIRTGIVSVSAGTVLLVGAIIMATSDPCGRRAGNSCQHLARNRAATVMAVPAGAMVAGGIVALGVGMSRRNALRLELQAHRRGGWIGVRGRF